MIPTRVAFFQGDKNAAIAVHYDCEKASGIQMIRESGYSPAALLDAPGASWKNFVGRGSAWVCLKIYYP
jgi:hypothetical protein